MGNWDVFSNNCLQRNARRVSRHHNYPVFSDITPIVFTISLAHLHHGNFYPLLSKENLLEVTSHMASDAPNCQFLHNQIAYDLYM